MTEVAEKTKNSQTEETSPVTQKLKKSKVPQKPKKERLTSQEITKRGDAIITVLDGDTRCGEAAGKAADEVRKALFHIRRFAERGVPEFEKIELDRRSVIDDAIVRNTMLVAEVTELNPQILFDMIGGGIISRLIFTDEDWRVLGAVIPFLAQHEEFLRHTLQQFSPRQRERVLETLECKTKTERVIKQALLKDREIPFWTEWKEVDGKPEIVKMGVDMHLKYFSKERFCDPKKAKPEGPINLPNEAEVTAQSKLSSMQRKNLREAEVAYKRIRDNIRRQVAYKESDARGLDGVALEWHLFHLDEAKKSSTNEAAKVTVEDLVKRKRLRCVKAINEKIVLLGGKPPLKYKEYIAGLESELKGNPEELAQECLRRIAAVESGAGLLAGIEGWIKYLQYVEKWASQWRGSYDEAPDDPEGLPF